MSHEKFTVIYKVVCGRWCVTNLCLTMPQMPRLPCMSQSATPATQEPAECPKCHACHAKRRWMSPSHQVTHLPRKTEVDVAKCTPACHAKWRGAPGDQSAPKRATRASPVRQVPRLLRETKVDVSKCHACHARRRWMSPATQNEGGCQQVPLLPRKTKVEVAKSHSSRHQSQPSAPSATPATQNEGGCHQVPRLPRKVARRRATKARLSAPPEPAQCPKCHAFRVKRKWMSPSATPATQNEGGCHQGPRLPRETKADVSKCHAKRR